MFSSKLEKRVQRMAVFEDSHGSANNWTHMNFISYNIIGLLKWILAYYSSPLRRPLFQNPYELETLCDRRELLLCKYIKVLRIQIIKGRNFCGRNFEFLAFLVFFGHFRQSLCAWKSSKLQSYFIEIHRYFSYFFVFLYLFYAKINLFL